MMSSTEVAKPHREPAHPTVITKCFGKGQGLSDLALIAQATRSIMTFDHACIDLLISQQLQDMLEFGFAMHYLATVVRLSFCKLGSNEPLIGHYSHQ